MPAIGKNNKKRRVLSIKLRRKNGNERVSVKNAREYYRFVGRKSINAVFFIKNDSAYLIDIYYNIIEDFLVLIKTL